MNRPFFPLYPRDSAQALSKYLPAILRSVVWLCGLGSLVDSFRPGILTMKSAASRGQANDLLNSGRRIRSGVVNSVASSNTQTL